jgi:hypothetical protein
MFTVGNGGQYLVGGLVLILTGQIDQFLPQLGQLGDICQRLVASVQVLALLNNTWTILQF